MELLIGCKMASGEWQKVRGGDHRRGPSLSSVSTVLVLLICTAVLVAAEPALGTQARQAGVPGSSQPRMHAELQPIRLGRPAAIRVGFTIPDPPGVDISPLTGMRLLLPAGMSIGASELGLQTCTQAVLEEEGPSGCPVNSVIGSGGATAEVPFGSQRVFEHVKILIFSAPLLNGKPQLVVSAVGQHPVIANIVFTGAALEAESPFGGVIETTMPPVPGLPGGPDVGLVSMQIAIGPRSLTYRETVHGKTVRFHPAGVVLPRDCARGGFPFEVQLGFMDGSSTTARTAVRCPKRHGRSARRHHMAKRHASAG